jgi:nitrate reductase gamma subunit
MVRFYAFLGVLAFLGLVWLYVREFTLFSNTVGIKSLVLGSMAVVGLLATVLLYLWRDRFTPLSRHFPAVVFILVNAVLFAPLLGSLTNRMLGKAIVREFKFISEKAYYAQAYGVLKGEDVRATGWVLMVSDYHVVRTFKYKTQAYYPISQPGDIVSLPMVQGLFGFEVLDLK